jgi:hypothetical protein
MGGLVDAPVSPVADELLSHAAADRRSAVTIAMPVADLKICLIMFLTSRWERKERGRVRS